MNQRPKVKIKTIKLIEESTVVNLYYRGGGSESAESLSIKRKKI